MEKLEKLEKLPQVEEMVPQLVFYLNMHTIRSLQ